MEASTNEESGPKDGAFRLSKSRFVAGRQCHRQLWWKVHEPGAPELVPDAASQLVFDRGHAVGELARTYVPGGVLVDPPSGDFEERVALTRAAIAAGAPAVYEASFFEDGVFVAVDILERQPRGWALVEVKSTTRVKPAHVVDAAIQAHVLLRAGVAPRRVEVMHLDRECRHPDLSNLFRRVDVTLDVAHELPGIPGELARQRAMLEGPLPDVATGDHCRSPHPCPFVSRCHAAPRAHGVETLYRLGKRVEALRAEGYETIEQLPKHVPLPPVADRQRRAVQSNRLVVEPGLRAALGALERPVAFLDFETIGPAVPLWPGCRPYDAVPVQVSVHTEAGGVLEHRAHLAGGEGDPREGLARAVVEACRGAATVVAWWDPLESTCRHASLSIL